MEEEKRASLRPVALCAIAFATVAVAGCLIAFPLVFQYVQSLEAGVHNDLDFCKQRARDMWREMIDIRHGSAAAAASGKVAKRSADHMTSFWARRLLDENADFVAEDAGVEAAATEESYGEDAFVQAGGSCCTCQRGIPGPPGPPGRDGRDSMDGQPGEFGPPGAPAPITPDLLPAPRELCPCEADKGQDGPPGPPGSDGPPGENGQPGNDGQPGDKGEAGPAGPPGQNGNPGQKGPPGTPGELRDVPSPPGRPGEPGRAGSPGESGRPGEPGKDGDNGSPGDKGDPGRPGQAGGPGPGGEAGDRGDPGPEGSCDHCAPPRLAQGY